MPSGSREGGLETQFHKATGVLPLHLGVVRVVHIEAIYNPVECGYPRKTTKKRGITPGIIVQEMSNTALVKRGAYVHQYTSGKKFLRMYWRNYNFFGQYHRSRAPHDKPGYHDQL